MGSSMNLSRLFGSGGGGGGTLPTRVVSSDETVESNYSIGIDTSEGPVTVTLPPDPEPGDRLSFFDAALTWDTNRAILNKNGHPLGIDSPELQEVILEDRGGVLELLFVNEALGWIDEAFYEVGTNPRWIGAFIAGRPVYSITNDDTPPLISSITSSTEWEVPQTGYYGINMSGGSGYAGSSISTNPPGGDSVFTVDGVNLITTKGSRGGKGLTTRPSVIDRNTILGFPLSESIIPSYADIVFYNEAILEEGVQFSFPVNELSVFGINLFTILGGTSSGSSPNYGYTVGSQSFILFLEEGSQVSVTIGAGGGGGSGGSHGNPGRCDIYDLNGVIV